MIDVLNDLIIAIYGGALKTLSQVPARGTHVCSPSLESHDTPQKLQKTSFRGDVTQRSPGHPCDQHDHTRHSKNQQTTVHIDRDHRSDATRRAQTI